MKKLMLPLCVALALVPSVETDAMEIHTEEVTMTELAAENQKVISYGTLVNADDTYISDEIQQACESVGAKYNICPELLEAIIESESSGKAEVSNGTCKGLMQVNETYHKDRMKRLGDTDLYSVYGNILVGTDYLYELVQEYEDIGMVLTAYNCGNANAEKLFAKGIYTSKYAEKITQRSWELERLHGK